MLSQRFIRVRVGIQQEQGKANKENWQLHQNDFINFSQLIEALAA